MERINVHLALRQIDALDSISGLSGLKRSELIRRAIDEYIDRVSARDRDEYHIGYTGASGVTNER
jgi:metal-responsive CopG/Arc/MetJ family transcriptional regulator